MTTEYKIQNYATKSPLFDNTSVWVKNNDNPSFDVTMDSFDDTEVSRS